MWGCAVYVCVCIITSNLTLLFVFCVDVVQLWNSTGSLKVGLMPWRPVVVEKILNWFTSPTRVCGVMCSLSWTIRQIWQSCLKGCGSVWRGPSLAVIPHGCGPQGLVWRTLTGIVPNASTPLTTTAERLCGLSPKTTHGWMRTALRSYLSSVLSWHNISSISPGSSRNVLLTGCTVSFIFTAET